MHSLIKRQCSNKVLIAVSIAEIWDMISFFGTLSIIVIFSKDVLTFDEEKSYVIYGTYVTLICGLPILCGMITDKFLGLYRSLIIGGSLLAIGDVLISTNYRPIFFPGLALTVCGTGLYKASCTNIVGLISKKYEEKNNNYSFFYLMLNIGAIIGPIIFGIIGKLLNLSSCFIFSGVGVFSSVILLRKYRSNIIDLNTDKMVGSIGNNLYGSLFILLILISSDIFFNILYSFDYIISLFYIIMFILLYKIIINQNTINKKNLFGVVLLLLFTTFFFAGSLQVGSSVTLFINSFIHVKIYNFNIPTEFFTSLDPLFLVLSAPIFNYIWRKLKYSNIEISSVIKLFIGLVMGGIGFLFFWLSTKICCSEKQMYQIIFLILGYVFIGAGEMCLTPPVMASISSYSPNKINTMMMGSWYFFMALSGYLGEILIRLSNVITSKVTSVNSILRYKELLGYSNTFFITSLLILSSGLLLFIFSKRINRLFSQSLQHQ